MGESIMRKIGFSRGYYHFFNFSRCVCFEMVVSDRVRRHVFLLVVWEPSGLAFCELVANAILTTLQLYYFSVFQGRLAVSVLV